MPETRTALRIEEAKSLVGKPIDAVSLGAPDGDYITIRIGEFTLYADAPTLYGPGEPPKPKRYLDFRFDVTDLTDEQISALALEVSVQAEHSDSDGPDSPGHPSVPYPEHEIVIHHDEEV